MRKSKHITKYVVGWQVTRIQCKEKKSVEDKVQHAIEYLELYKNEHAWERVVNYLEGLAMGYKTKNTQAFSYINDKIKICIDNKTLYMCDVDTDDVLLSSIDTKTLIKLYKDLVTRSSKWLDKGYVHAEQSAFEDILSSELSNRGYDMNHHIQISKRIHALSIANTHSFFF